MARDNDLSANGFPRLTAAEVFLRNRPPYCFATTWRLYFNQAVVNNTNPCSSNYNCLCKNGIKTTGTIEPDCHNVTSSEDCEFVARRLGLGDTTAHSTHGTNAPSGCYYARGSELYFNSAVEGNTSPCTGTRQCLLQCQQDPQKGKHFICIHT